MEIGSDLWTARVNALLSAASGFVASAEKPRNRFASFLSVYQMYLKLDMVSRDLDAILAAAERAVSLQAVADVETYRLRRDLFLQLHAPCSRLASLRDRLPPNGRLREKIARLAVQAERLLDLADWCDAMSGPEETNAKFDAALADLAKGDVVPWAAVR
jgi:CRP-like cAMP-binding protein